MTVIANSQNQKLSSHLAAVAVLSKKIIQALNKKRGGGKQSLLTSALYAGLLHDIGKAEFLMQKYLQKSGDLYELKDGRTRPKSLPYHQEISLLFAALIPKENCISTQVVKHAVIWHHAEKKRDGKGSSKIQNIYKDLKTIYSKKSHNVDLLIASMLEIYNEAVMLVNSLDEKALPLKSLDDFVELDALPPAYKVVEEGGEIFEDLDTMTEANSDANIVRSALISADRYISTLTNNDLEILLGSPLNFDEAVNFILQEKTDLSQKIQESINRFHREFGENSERNISQTKAATDLSRGGRPLSILSGPAGCGKTKVGLEWAMRRNAQKIIWVCPRKDVCLGVYKELQDSMYLPTSKLELLIGSQKETFVNGNSTETVEGEEFGGEVVITTIDQIVNLITGHRCANSYIHFLNAHVVFDEYHELILDPGLNVLLIELLKSKNTLGLKTLLISATTDPLFVDKILKSTLKFDLNLVGMESFNQEEFLLNIVAYDELESPLPEMKIEEGFIISNTAKDAQKGFLTISKDREKTLLIHSKLTPKDRESAFKDAMNSFGPEATNPKYKILKAGPIVQASLNISCGRMLTDMTSPENLLQRLGRLNRFAENKGVSCLTVYVPENKKSSVSRFLSNNYSEKRSREWINFLLKKPEFSEGFTLNQIYQAYKNFYKALSPKSERALVNDLSKAFRRGIEVFESRIGVPKDFKYLQPDEADLKKIPKGTIRGSSVYVEMAKLELSKGLENPVSLGWSSDDQLDNLMSLNKEEVIKYLGTNLTEVNHLIDLKKGEALNEGLKTKSSQIKGLQNLKCLSMGNEISISDPQFLSGLKKPFKSVDGYLNDARSPLDPILLSHQEGGKVMSLREGYFYCVIDGRAVGAMKYKDLKNISINNQ